MCGMSVFVKCAVEADLPCSEAAYITDDGLTIFAGECVNVLGAASGASGFESGSKC